MDGKLFIDVSALERKPLLFESSIDPKQLDLSEGWTLSGPVEAAGRAELLDPDGLRTIRVRGHLRARAAHECDRCLQEIQRDFDDDFDLYFYPMAMIEQGGETAIGRDEIEVGFYEGAGVQLADVLREQVMLWLPERGLCRPDCKGLCPACGTDRNRAPCDCSDSFEDPRWDSLRQLKLKH